MSVTDGGGKPVRLNQHRYNFNKGSAVYHFNLSYLTNKTTRLPPDFIVSIASLCVI